MKKGWKIFFAILFGLLFAAILAGIKLYDVAKIGPAGTENGFSHINQWFAELVGENMLFYEITEYLGWLAFGVAGFFAMVGFVQLVKRKGFAKVDREIYVLAGLYIIVIGLYFFFNYYAINYRPVLMSGEIFPEPSFPSSHTMLTVTVMGGAMMMMKYYIDSKGLRIFLKILCWLVLLATIAGRLLSGVHWLTDIVGGIFLSVMLLNIFSLALNAEPRESRRYIPKH